MPYDFKTLSVPYLSIGRMEKYTIKVRISSYSSKKVRFLAPEGRLHVW